MKKKTIVLGASTNPERYSNLAVNLLESYKHPIIAFGIKQGIIGNTSISTIFPEIQDTDTITMYLGPKNQESYLSKIVALQPKRVIFNPGTENPSFYKRLEEAGIEVLEACTLVLLRTGQY
ncbi:MAG: CoA-binding protein [Saprospiraceae bacterium]|nr:CoA-binding protein [Saprospiraceae bacterium]